MPLRLSAALIPALLLATAARAGDKPSFADAKAFVATYCVSCHGEKERKGGLSLAGFDGEKKLLGQRAAWRGVADRLKAGDMPPDGAKQPPKAEADAVRAWVTKTLDAADADDLKHPDPGPPLARRLTANEYNRTVKDLTGVTDDVAAAVGWPDEGNGEGFDNTAAALTFSDAVLEKCFAAAGLVVEKVYAPAKGAKPGDRPPLLARLTVPNDPKATITNFARRAYRRPLAEDEAERLLALFEKAKAGGATADDALRPVFKAVLASPHFLLRVERNRPNATEPYRVGDHELAVRLSYFLWSTMPDDELFAAADKGELGKPAVLDAQVRRMLKDPKAKALTDGFAGQWLQLKKLDRARPSTEFFPTFTGKLKQAMRDEAVTFVDHLRTDDRPVTDLLASDYTYLNADLAAHYGIAGVAGEQFRKVALTDPARGGLLGMGAVLAMTSHTSRTSPTLRGKYVLDVILGTPPPPPPPGAGQLDEAKAPKELKTFRDKLAAHASNSTCAGCHAKIDPLGFGLENFDAVGRWRKSGDGVDATGKLPGGEAFDGPTALRAVLVKKRPRFVENVAEKMLEYALGRPLRATDRPAVAAVAGEMQANGFRFSAAVAGVAKSFPFEHRRNPTDDE